MLEQEVRHSLLEQCCRYSRNALRALGPRYRHRSLDRVSIAIFMSYIELRSMLEGHNSQNASQNSRFGPKELHGFRKYIHSLNPKCQSLDFSALCVLTSALASHVWMKIESHFSKNFLPTNVPTVHSFLEALPMPDFSRLSHSSSSGGEVSILPVFASRTRTRTLDVCIARYCRNLRVAGSLRLMFAHMKLRTSMMT